MLLDTHGSRDADFCLLLKFRIVGRTHHVDFGADSDGILLE